MSNSECCFFLNIHTVVGRPAFYLLWNFLQQWEAKFLTKQLKTGRKNENGWIWILTDEKTKKDSKLKQTIVVCLGREKLKVKMSIRSLFAWFFMIRRGKEARKVVYFEKVWPSTQPKREVDIFYFLSYVNNGSCTWSLDIEKSMFLNLVCLYSFRAYNSSSFNTVFIDPGLDRTGSPWKN